MPRKLRRKAVVIQLYIGQGKKAIKTRKNIINFAGKGRVSECLLKLIRHARPSLFDGQI